jgi:large subunit ribosomal protein L2
VISLIRIGIFYDDKNHLLNNSMFLFKKTHIKALTLGKITITGLNRHGLRILRRRGGGHKNIYRCVDFLNYIHNIFGLVLRHEYDPMRTAALNLILCANGVLIYRLAVAHVIVGAYVGGVILNYMNNAGFWGDLKNIPVGNLVHAISLRFLRPSLYIRAGGCTSKYITKSSRHGIIKLKSSLYLKVPLCVQATCGSVIHITSFFRYR